MQILISQILCVGKIRSRPAGVHNINKFNNNNNNKDFGTKTAPQGRFPTPRSFSLRNPNLRSLGEKSAAVIPYYENNKHYTCRQRSWRGKRKQPHAAGRSRTQLHAAARNRMQPKVLRKVSTSQGEEERVQKGAKNRRSRGRSVPAYTAVRGYFTSRLLAYTAVRG